MRWFKHLSTANRDESLAIIINEMGLEGYGLYWLILETIAEQMSKDCTKTSVRLPIKTWARISGVSPKKFQSLAKLLEKFGNFTDKSQFLFIKNGSNWIEVDCPNLLKYRDEYAKKRSRKSG